MRSEIGSVRGEVGGVRSEIGTVRGEIGSVRDEVSNVRGEVAAMSRTLVQVSVGALATLVVGFGGTIATVLTQL